MIKKRKGVYEEFFLCKDEENETHSLEDIL